MEGAALVAIGAIGGALSRWKISKSVSPSWPATCAINVAGSFALGLAVGNSADRRPRMLLLAGTGFLGSFTTFSTFSVDTMLLLEQGHVMRALGVGLGTPALGICAAAAGLSFGRFLARRGAAAAAAAAATRSSP